MILNYQFKFSQQDFNKFGLPKIGQVVMQELGLDDDEFEQKGDLIIGTATLVSWNVVSPLRMANYDIQLTYSEEKQKLVLKIRAYKIFLIATFFTIFGYLVHGFFGAIVAFILVSSFVLLALFIEMFIRRVSIKDALDFLKSP